MAMKSIKKIFSCLVIAAALASCNNDGIPGEYEPCTEDYDQRCFENVAQMCEGGEWKDIEDCTTKTCDIVVIDEIVDVKCISY
jgi:hypothetical protein